MKNSQFVSAVVCRDDTVVISTFNTKAPEYIKVKKSIVNSDLPYSVKAMLGVSTLLEQMSNADVKGRVSVIVPEVIFPRMLQATKLVYDNKDLVQYMTLAWMDHDEHKEAWYFAINAFAQAFLKVTIHGIKVNWVNARKLAMWQIEGNVQDLEDGDLLIFNKGVCEEYGITCHENELLSGPKTVHTNGDKYYVWRDITTNYYGEPNVAGTFVLNARRLIKEAKKLLPAYKQA